MNKYNLVIAEGPQGVGKTTLTNWLREHMKYSNLHRLTGIEDNSRNAEYTIREIYSGLSDYIRYNSRFPAHMIFDRIWFSEQVYCTLGYKPYNFDAESWELTMTLPSREMDVTILSLFLENMDGYEQRLRRDKPDYVKFDVSTSIRQQIEYENLFDHVALHFPRINVYKVPMDNPDDWQNTMRAIFGDAIQ